MNLKKLLFLSALTFTTFLVNAQEMKTLGALEFSPEGILFAGDKISGAIHAFDLSAEKKSIDKFEINAYNVDAQVAATLGTSVGNVKINDMAVHPKSGEVYLSVTRGHAIDALPVLIKVNATNQLQIIDLASVKRTSQTLSKLPDGSQNFIIRGTMAPATIKEIEKSKLPMRTLSIMDIEYHKGEVFVAGITNENFCSALRRMPYPFNGTESVSNIEMFHIAHDEYETRAPIRSFLIENIDGKDQMVAAYTCSPLVLIPLDELKNGAKVKARTLGDMGNGQPLDMVSFSMKGNNMIFVTSNSRTPRVIPVGGLNKAKVYTENDFKRGGKTDMDTLPVGPMGRPVMFTGSALHIALLNPMEFATIRRDPETGSMDLETVSIFFPNKLNNVMAEMDFPQYAEEHKNDKKK